MKSNTLLPFAFALNERKKQNPFLFHRVHKLLGTVPPYPVYIDCPLSYPYTVTVAVMVQRTSQHARRAPLSSRISAVCAERFLVLILTLTQTHTHIHFVLHNPAKAPSPPHVTECRSSASGPA